MKIEKRVLCPQRLRQVPSQFSWIDQRLVRQGKYLAGCSVRALALYLILVTVCDAEGLSYYSDRTLQRMLGLSADQLVTVRSSTGTLSQIVARPFQEIRSGNALMYYPEANILIPRTADPKSRTPAFKCVLVNVEPEAS